MQFIAQRQRATALPTDTGRQRCPADPLPRHNRLALIADGQRADRALQAGHAVCNRLKRGLPDQQRVLLRITGLRVADAQGPRATGDDLPLFIDQHGLGVAGAFIDGQNQRGVFIHALDTRHAEMPLTQTCSGRDYAVRINAMHGTRRLTGTRCRVFAITNAKANQGDAQCVLGQQFGHQAAKPAVDIMFFDSNHPATAAQGAEQRITLQRTNRRQVDDLRVEPLLRQLRRGVDRLMHHRTQCDDGQV
ncbi:Beta-glucosidase/6-phospho-beta-glucosidase/ beta-galactosidase [Pseudomonas syringae pv. actinidiae]|uniref:Beta-glucosidase/6-phospho-beta-glucosidase/ beta-galactosidase n=1 Tax=Pseudomonas syringae pv. actinidiae TaxID=103796 RepID=A0A2V0QMP3_PSESF|nr:Beta-glucosidase/6-phospho-beta-glucosidase/ beta-galactosidase [Pseudomonas syringae pv. actinidiae]